MNCLRCTVERCRVKLLCQLTRCLTTVITKKSVQLFFVKIRGTFSTRSIFEAKLLLIESSKPFPTRSFSNEIWAINIIDLPSGFCSTTAAIEVEQKDVSGVRVCWLGAPLLATLRDRRDHVLSSKLIGQSQFTIAEDQKAALWGELCSLSVTADR